MANGKERIRFTRQEISLINLFDSITGASTVDCAILPDKGTNGETERIIFMVHKRDLTKALGKNGINVKKLKDKLSKSIDIIVYSDDLFSFIRDIFYPIKIKGIEDKKLADGRRIIIVHVDPRDLGLAIGKNGRNIHRAKFFVRRHFNVDNLIITGP